MLLSATQTPVDVPARLALLAPLVVALLWPATVAAHGGGLNADGCHTNRKTGDYHCHRAQAVQRPAQVEAAPAQAASSVMRSPAAPTCYTGPRGGTYTLTKSGKKNYNGC